MPNYFIIENDTIINFIIAESQEIAELVTGLTAIEIKEDRDINMQIGSSLIDGNWVRPDAEVPES